MIMANLVCYLNWLLVVLALCTLQGDATFNKQYNKYVRVSFKRSEYTVKESDGRVAITIEADRRYFYGSFYVKIRASVNEDLDPYASSYDFEESFQAVWFSYKQSTATVYIKIKDDDRVEDTEAFQVELLRYSRGVQLGKPARAIVFIKDDDKAMVTKGPSFKSYGVHVRFGHKEYRVKESDGHAEIKVIVDGRRNFPIQVVAKSFVPTKFNLPAATGDDFKVGEYKVYFPVNYNVATIKIPIYNDYIVEGTEAFAISLYISEHYRNKHVQYGDPFLTKVIIDDDDRHPVTKPPPPPTTEKPHPPTVKPIPSIYAQFSHDKYVVYESAGYAKVEVTVSGHRSFPISVNVRIFVSDKFEPRAASTNDVQVGETRLVFYPHEKSKTVRVGIKDDKLIEGTEAFGVKLIIPDHHIKNGLKLGNPSLAVVYIKDDDKPPATKPPTTMPPTKPPTPRPPKRPPVTKIRFEYSVYEVEESCTLLSVTLVLKGVVTKPFTVGVIPMGHYMLSAQAGKDFETGVVKVTFQPYQTRASVCIVITDDDIKEKSEKFRLILSIPYSARALGIWGTHPYYADVVIIDDVDDGLGLPVQIPPTDYERTTLCKCKPRPTTPTPTPPTRPSPSPSPSPSPPPVITISFKESSYSNVESGGNITFTVQAFPAFTKLFSVGFCTQNSNPVSAQDGVDYTAAQDVVVTFLPGEDCVLVNVGITDDSINEENETFIGILKSLDATPSNVLIGAPSRAIGTIINDDPIIVQFLKNTSSALESAGVIAFTVISLVRSDRPFSVQVLTREIDSAPTRQTDSPPAEAGVDYVTLIQDIVFNPGEDSKDIFVNIIDDLIVERNELFEVFLQRTPDSPNVILGNPSVATGIIIDDDKIIVQFLNDTTSALESAGVIAFTVISLSRSDRPFSVQVCTREINSAPTRQTDSLPAEAGVDYITLVQDIVFNPGEDRKDIFVNITDDLIVESDESFEVFLKLTPESPNVTLGDPSVATGIIIDDDDELIVQFLNDTTSALESAGVIAFTVISLSRSDRPFSVQVCTREINSAPTRQTDSLPAEAGVDYITLVQDIVFNPGEDRKDIFVNITDDLIVESDESFEVFLKLTPESPNVILGDPSVATGIIIDDDELTVRFLNDASSAVESDGFMSFTLVSSAPADTPFSVQVFTRDIDPPSAEADVDYFTLVQNITFESGETLKVFNVSIVNDTLPEIDESFEVVLMLLPDFPDVNIGVPSVAIGTIFDDDLPVVQFLNNASSALESDGVISFTVISLMPTDRVFSVQVCTRDIGSAVAGVDYVSLVEMILTFNGSDNSQVVSVNIIDDLIAESDESFEVFLKLIPGSENVILGNPSVATGVILDNEIPSVRFLSNTTSVGESDGVVSLTLVSSFAADSPFTVQVFTMDKEGMTATRDMDFMPIIINITFEAGEMIKNFTVPIIPDEVVEEDETFYVRLEGFADQPNNISEPDGVCITINDDDITVRYENIVVRGDESAGRLTFVLVTSEPAVDPFTVQVRTTELNETGGGPAADFATADVDYDSDVIDVVFNAGDNRVTVSINITDDNVDEGDEAFGLVLERTGGTPDTVQIIGPTTAFGIIEDNDEPGVRFQSNSSAAAESAGSISFVVELTMPADTVITVQVCTEETTPVPSAEGNGVDFTDVVQNVTFDIGETTQNVLVPISRDSIAEPTEEFNLVLKLVPGGDTNITILEPSVSVGIILDTAPVTVQFADESVVNSEGDLSMMFELELSGPVNNPFDVEVCTRNGSALGEGIDFTTVSTSVTFPAGSTSQIVNVTLNDDDILEPTEQYQVFIKSIIVTGEEPIPPVVLGDIIVANGTILDNDDFTVMFNASNYTGAEADGVIPVTVVATGVSSLPYTVTITPSELAEVSARELFDFSNDTIVVTFNPGETEQTVDVVINPDCAREGSEFFNLALSLDPVSTPSGITLGDPSTATAEIADTDIIFVNFSQPAFSATEASGMMKVTVEADGFSIWPYSIEINPMEILPVGAPGNAEGNGTDFDSATLIAVFNPGDSQVDVSMPVIMDQIFESTESLQFSLTVPAEFSNMNGRLLIKPGSNNVAVGEILDSNVLVNFSTDSYRAGVNATNVVVRVMAFGSFDTPFLVEVVPDVAEDIPEKEPFFDPTPREVLFPLGVTTALVTVPLFPEAVGNTDVNFIVRLVVPVAAMSQGVILGEPNISTVTVPATRP